MEIGVKIKTLRTAKGVTLKTLAERTGLSVGFISNVEREVNNPTISSLQQICEALDTNLADFFSVPANHGIVIRKSEGQKLDLHRSKGAAYALFPLPAKKLQASMITVEPGGHYGDAPTGHEGEEICMVTRGAVEFIAGGQSYLLEEGDLIYIDPFVPHELLNHSDAPAVTYWVTAYGPA